MSTEAKIQLSSTELATVWINYQSISASILIFDLFKEKTIDKLAQNILSDYVTECQNIKSKIVNILTNQQAAIPLGFIESDIIRTAPPLFDDFFNIMFLRQMTKLTFGNAGLSLAMSYMKEVNDLFKLNYDVANNFYMLTTNYLLEKGVLPRPPYVGMPLQVEFIEKPNYIAGLNLLTDKRALNTIEVAYITESIQDNVLGMQMMTGFAQVAKDKEVKKYFKKGNELSKKIVTDLSNTLLQSDIQPSTPWGGKATSSQVPPFSDKLMMFVTSLIASSGIGYTAMGTSFSMRSDLHLKFGLIAKNIFDFSVDGGKLMIKHMWMEEPPQMEDRNQLTK